MTSRAGLARARSSSLPPTMIVSLPASASAVLPLTGASRMPAPLAWTAGATERIVDGRTVLMSTTTDPARMPAGMPSGPSWSAATASPLATMLMAISTLAARAPGVGQAVAPRRSASSAAGPGERL